jgi:hypothetical protein
LGPDHFLSWSLLVQLYSAKLRSQSVSEEQLAYHAYFLQELSWYKYAVFGHW